jgi:LEA14-like dessication related protein
LKKLYTILAIATGVYLFKKINLAKKISFELNNIQLSGSVLNPLIFLKIKVINPTSTTANFENLNGVISLNNIKIGIASLDSKMLIAANTFTFINLKLQIDSIAFVQNLMNAITNKTGIINFKGTATVDSLNLPINYDYKL